MKELCRSGICVHKKLKDMDERFRQDTFPDLPPCPPVIIIIIPRIALSKAYNMVIVVFMMMTTSKYNAVKEDRE